ncbi:MAG: IS3 family transposase [Gemmatimonadota bacterium]|nr:IS3 family transposase [Gemmatimonadota bacterium]
MTGYSRAPICRALEISRATAYRGLVPRGRRYVTGDDRVVRARVRHVIRTRGSYGYRRVTALVNREFGAGYNRKRIRRVMELNGWNLPRPGKRTTGRAHTGRVARERSNERWCSDTLEIACWNGEVVELGFALDCADREWLAYVGEARALRGEDIRALMHAAVRTRFDDGRPGVPIQWLSDNGGIYTALETVIVAERLGLVPITTPAYSPQSNGMAEAFVRTLRRDYIAGADLSSAAAVLRQLAAWQADYNGIAPHSALGYRAPHEHRAARAAEVG